jgi:cation diffusion facilitator CzcD-associated flavoprotein CzcO
MTLQPKNLLIIGGGPCGLITLRNCLHRGTFTKVQLVERHDDVGGVWYVLQVLWLTLSLQYRTILEGIKITLLTIVSDGPHLHTLGS